MILNPAPAITDDEFASMLPEGRVHRRLYTDPAVFDIEMTRVFAGNWSYLAHESQIPGPGDFVQVELGRRPVLLARSANGGLDAVLNRCAHRGAVLVAEPSGHCKRYTCPYHGWSYATDGRLVALPFPSSYPADSDRSRFDLGRVTVASYRGFVFGTLAEQPPTLIDWLGNARSWFDAHVDRHPGGELAVLPSAVRLEYAGNWKLAWDNAADGLHATFTHRSYNHLGHGAQVDTVLARDPNATPMYGLALGNGHMVVDQRPGITAGPWSTMRPVPFAEVLEAEVTANGDPATLDLACGSMVNLSLFPNLILVGNQLMVVEPLAADRTRLTMYLVTAPGASAEINLLRLRTDEDFVSFGTPDDLAMFERVQAGLRIPEMEWVDMSRGMGAGDQINADGLVQGSIASEAATRGYLAEYRRLISRGVA